MVVESLEWYRLCAYDHGIITGIESVAPNASCRLDDVAVRRNRCIIRTTLRSARDDDVVVAHVLLTPDSLQEVLSRMPPSDGIGGLSFVLVALTTLSLDFGSNHEAANVGFPTYEKIMGVRSSSLACRYAFKAVDVHCYIAL